jgi:hypothetical protein
MADTVRRVEHQYATVPDAPGEEQRMLSALQKRGVNLVSFLGFAEGGQAQPGDDLEPATSGVTG